MTIPSEPVGSPVASERNNPYRVVVLVLALAAAAGAVVVLAAGISLGLPALLHAAITLLLSAGILTGVAIAQARGSAVPSTDLEALSEPDPDCVPAPPSGAERLDAPGVETDRVAPGAPTSTHARRARLDVSGIASAIRRWRPAGGAAQQVRRGAAWLSLLGVFAIRWLGAASPDSPPAVVAALVAIGCLGAAGLAATAVRYLADIHPAALPVGEPLARGARVAAWMLLLTGVAVGLQWAEWPVPLSVINAVIIVVNLALALELFAKDGGDSADALAVDFTITRALGSRSNACGSLMDTAQAQLGIDLRSTWALTVVRHSLEPLAMGLAVVGWLFTSMTVVAVDEQGLVERFGVPHAGAPLAPGMHLHLPWPIDRVVRIPVQRVQTLAIGHEGPAEEPGPEDVLWARVHAENEYTLLLGDGRDLITVDAAVQFRIVDARAWRYNSQNPADALRAIAYRAVMRTTVGKTLTDALSENLVTTTARMRAMVQEDANALGIGIQVVAFTVGGMHLPVMVAADYQAVVSAELRKVSAIVNAQALRNRTVPFAQSEALVGTNRARADAAADRARAAGEAWSFRALEAQYGASPNDYFFRRRLEALERALTGRRFTVIDTRIQRDGGELWITP